MVRITYFLFVLVCFTPAPVSAADDTPKPDLAPLQAQVAKLVDKYYPKAKIEVKLEDGTIGFRHNTRKFMVHEALLTGEFQDAFEQTGPKLGGIMGTLEWREGKYGGQAAVPQTFDVRYFKTYLLAPHSEKLGGHLYIHLTYPSDVSKKFVMEFVALIEGFDRHVAAPKK